MMGLKSGWQHSKQRECLVVHQDTGKRPLTLSTLGSLYTGVSKILKDLTHASFFPLFLAQRQKLPEKNRVCVVNETKKVYFQAGKVFDYKISTPESRNETRALKPWNPGEQVSILTKNG